jgi:hypothetical protein
MRPRRDGSEGRWSFGLGAFRLGPRVCGSLSLLIMEGSAEGRGTVLVVEADPGERERFGSWLDEAGFTVLVCPGPTEPDYTCVGSREGICPLVGGANAVVLDMSLDSEAVMMGTAAEELLGLYQLAGRPVVILGSYRSEEAPHQITRLARHPAPAELVDAVKSLLPAEA